MKAVIEFYRNGCTPCRVMKPLVRELSKKHGVPLKQVEVTHGIHEAQLYNVKSVPTLVMLEGEREIKRLVGAVSRKELEHFFEQGKP